MTAPFLCQMKKPELIFEVFIFHIPYTTPPSKTEKRILSLRHFYDTFYAGNRFFLFLMHCHVSCISEFSKSSELRNSFILKAFWHIWNKKSPFGLIVLNGDSLLWFGFQPTAALMLVLLHHFFNVFLWDRAFQHDDGILPARLHKTLNDFVIVSRKTTFYPVDDDIVDIAMRYGTGKIYSAGVITKPVEIIEQKPFAMSLY